MEAVMRWLTQSQPGRRLTIWMHPRLHRGWTQPLAFGNGCILCRAVQRQMWKMIPRDAFEDHSSIRVSEPEYNEDGSIKKHGIQMSATAKRQLDALIAKDPELEQKLRETMEEIARNPGPEGGN